jgi:hypothetical protein
MKGACYRCRYRGDVPGDAHSQCLHPWTATTRANPLNQLLAIMGKQAGLPTCLIDEAAARLHVQGHPQGIRHGWFLWPVNFDPTWLVSCDGFDPSDAEHIAMMQTPARWPLQPPRHPMLILALKRIVDGDVIHAYLLDERPIIRFGNVYMPDPSDAAFEFADHAAIVAAGWKVD